LKSFGPKAAGDNDKRYGFDLSDNLEPGEVVTGVTSITATPGDLTISNPSYDGNTMVSFTAAGGVPGVTYTVTAIFSISNAPHLERSALLPVVAKL